MSIYDVPKGTGGGGGILSNEQETDLETPEGLEALAREKGLEPPSPNKFMSALQTVGGILGTTGSFVTGTISGALDEDKSVFTEGAIRAKESFVDKKPYFFSDLLKDQGVEPETRAGKIALGVTSFAADVVLDPLTYLTFGAGTGMRITTAQGAKRLSKEGTKIFQEATSNLAAKGVRGDKAERMTQRLFQEAMGKKGVTPRKIEEYLKLGFKRGDVEVIARSGKEMLDKGGIRFAGKTLVTSQTLAKTPVGKAAKRLGQTETVKAIKHDLGKLFIPDFLQNKFFTRTVRELGIAQRKSLKKLLQKQDDIFKNLNENEVIELADNIWSKKVNIPIEERRIIAEEIKNLRKHYPELKVNSVSDARNVLNGLEDATTGRINRIRAETDRITKGFFKKRRDEIRAGTIEMTSKDQRMMELDDMVKGLRQLLKKTKKEKGEVPALPDGTALPPQKYDRIFDNEQLAGNYLVYEEQRLEDTIIQLTNMIEKVKKAPQGTSIKGIPNLKKATPAEILEASEEMIFKLQEDLANQSMMLGKILDARKLSKAKQMGQTLKFDNPKLQKAADELFENPNALVPRMARHAGISEEEVIKFYIPSKFRDRGKVKDFVKGNNLSSPKMGFTKLYEGVDTDDLIKDPREAYALGAMEVTTARLKSQTIRKMFGKLGKNLSPEAAERMGYEKVTKKVMGKKGGREEITTWLPKDVVEAINDFDTPKRDHFSELARWSGYDYATAVFKGYVTSLFPGFHVRNIVSNQFQNMLMIGSEVLNPKNHLAAIKAMGGVRPAQNIRKKIGRGLTEIEYDDIMKGRNLDSVLKGDKGSMSYAQAKKLFDRAAKDDYITTKTGKKISLRQIRKEIEKRTDFLEEGAYGRTARHLDLVKEQHGTISKYNPLNPRNLLMTKTMEWGFLADSQAKMTAIISQLKLGKSFDEAIEIAEQATFNYGKLTRFERNVMRRLIPFYTFGRKNAELQIKAMAGTPGRTAAMFKLAPNASVAIGEPFTEEDKEGLPNFILNNLGIKAGGWADSDGKPQFLSGFGLPVEEFLGRMSGPRGIASNIVQTTITQLNPLVKFPLEQATGQDFFRDRPIAEINDGEPLREMVSMFEALPDPVEKQFKDLIQWSENKVPEYKDGEVVGEKTEYKANPFALHLMRNMFTSRLQNTIGFINDEEQSRMLRAIRFFTGVHAWSIDKETQEFFNDLERSTELKDYLERMGVGSTFERFYERKEENGDGIYSIPE